MERIGNWANGVVLPGTLPIESKVKHMERNSMDRSKIKGSKYLGFNYRRATAAITECIILSTLRTGWIYITLRNPSLSASIESSPYRRQN